MAEFEGLVTLQGSPVTLVGEEVEIDRKAPDFTVTGNDMQPVECTSFLGSVVVISSVSSLDTPVCDMETRKFNTEAASLADDVVVLTVSMDLPFAQKRWCAAAGVDRVITLSDYLDTQFGLKYGVLIKELRLLARAVFVVDRDGVVRYKELVKEITNEPDYAAVLKAVQKYT
jgi:thiol peroxidase